LICTVGSGSADTWSAVVLSTGGTSALATGAGATPARAKVDRVTERATVARASRLLKRRGREGEVIEDPSGGGVRGMERREVASGGTGGGASGLRKRGGREGEVVGDPSGGGVRGMERREVASERGSDIREAPLEDDGGLRSRVGDLDDDRVTVLVGDREDVGA